MSRREPLKPQAATLAEALPEADATIPTGTSLAADPTDADAESGDAGSTTAQATRTARGRGEPHRTAAAPGTAKASPSAAKASDARRAPSAVTPSAEAGPPPISPISPLSTGPAAEEPGAWLTPPSPHPGNQEAGPQAASEEEDLGHPPSRLSGLRNLLVSLGRRSLIEDESGDDEADTEPRFERATVRPVFHEAPAREKEPAGSASAPVRVTAPPEFLPPQPAAEADKEKEPLRPTPPVPRRERESPDEIQTLPSWRGQYRKKRYPPI